MATDRVTRSSANAGPRSAVYKLAELVNDLRAIVNEMQDDRAAILEGSVVWNPGSLADGVGETSAGITVTGAALGDFVIAAAPYDLQDITMSAYVQAANTVEIRLQNEGAATVDLASGTFKVLVIPSGRLNVLTAATNVDEIALGATTP